MRNGCRRRHDRNKRVAAANERRVCLSLRSSVSQSLGRQFRMSAAKDLGDRRHVRCRRIVQQDERKKRATHSTAPQKIIWIATDTSALRPEVESTRLRTKRERCQSMLALEPFGVGPGPKHTGPPGAGIARHRLPTVERPPPLSCLRETYRMRAASTARAPRARTCACISMLIHEPTAHAWRK